MARRTESGEITLGHRSEPIIGPPTGENNIIRPLPKKERTPSAENRALKQQVAELKEETKDLATETKKVFDKERWMRVGRVLGIVVVGAASTYGATRSSGEDKAKKTEVAVDEGFKENKKNIIQLQQWVKANAAEIKANQAMTKAAIKQASHESKNQIAMLQRYVEGVFSGLAMRGGNGGRRRASAREMEAAKRELEAKEAELKVAQARAAAALKHSYDDVRSRVRRPRLTKPAQSIKMLLHRREQRKEQKAAARGPSPLP
jgi:hypothetical protein